MDENQRAEEVLESTELGRAFTRLFTEEGFLVAVLDDAAAATAEYELSDDDLEALVADAEALEGEVGAFGFGRRTMAAPGGMSQLLNTLGGLHVPGRLDLNPRIALGVMITHT